MTITRPCTKLPYLGSAIIPVICTAFDQSDSNYTILHWNDVYIAIGYCNVWLLCAHKYMYVQAIVSSRLPITIGREKALSVPLPL